MNQEPIEPTMAPERVINSELYKQLQAINAIKGECVKLLTLYNGVGIKLAPADETSLYDNLDECIRTLTLLAGAKYLSDVKNGYTEVTIGRGISKDIEMPTYVVDGELHDLMASLQRSKESYKRVSDNSAAGSEYNKSINIHMEDIAGIMAEQLYINIQGGHYNG